MTNKVQFNTRQQKILLEKALKIDPNNSKLFIAYRELCQKEHEIQSASEIFEYCTICLQKDEIEKALRCCEKALDYNPNDDLVSIYCKLFINTNNMTRILQTLVKILEKDPLNVRAQAMIAYFEQKNDNYLHTLPLYDLKRDVRIYDNQIHKDHIDDLIASIKSNFMYVFEPERTSTKRGGQAFIDYDNYQFMDALVASINTQIKSFSKDLFASGHPNMASSLLEYELSMWTVLLKKGGHQVSHIHPSGCISGVIYLKTPRVDASQAGCLEIGSAPSGILEPFHDILRIQPKPGLMVLFPSYYYHRTIPTITNEERISISFDVISKRQVPV